ncbi:MAG: hypothetical protein JOY60_12905 [Burkholderiaceae bacterium]|nr:hypothetical protein [Roseateles sp.]MBV8470744.1 hypothetical protein [Burkholderiaceae bacterium]
MSAIHPSDAGLFFERSSTPKWQSAAKAGRGPGLAAVILFHLLLIWALASGLAQKAYEIVKKPIMMSVIDEAPPPPPPPPKLERVKEQPRDVPPPAYVPPPEVTPAVTPPPAIQAVQSVVPHDVPPAPAPAAPAPVAAPAKPEVQKDDIAVACPGYQRVIAQSLEDAFDRFHITGTVHSLIKVRGDQVVDVIPESGPKAYYKAVQAAARRIKCSAGGADEVQVSLDVNFAP